MTDHLPTTRTKATGTTLRFSLSGTVGADDFLPWMKNHAVKLGVTFATTEALPHRISITAQGAPEMLEAFALGCSLGPQSVYVKTLQIMKSAPILPGDKNTGSQPECADL